eukprot:7325088-Prymnesium_polylepis.1
MDSGVLETIAAVSTCEGEGCARDAVRRFAPSIDGVARRRCCSTRPRCGARWNRRASGERATCRRSNPIAPTLWAFVDGRGSNDKLWLHRSLHRIVIGFITSLRDKGDQRAIANATAAPLATISRSISADIRTHCRPAGLANDGLALAGMLDEVCQLVLTFTLSLLFIHTASLMELAFNCVALIFIMEFDNLLIK